MIEAGQFLSFERGKRLKVYSTFFCRAVPALLITVQSLSSDRGPPPQSAGQRGGSWTCTACCPVNDFRQASHHSVPQAPVCEMGLIVTILSLHNNIPQTGGLNNRHLLCLSSGSWKSKIKVLADLVSGEGSFPGWQRAALWLCPQHARERACVRE